MEQDAGTAGTHEKPKPRGWAMPIAAALFGLALFIPGYFIQHPADVNARTYSASVTGTVQAGAHEELRGHETSCAFSYQFTPDGADSADVYTGTGSDNGVCGGTAQAEGAHRTVYYNPGNPRENTTQNPNGLSNRYVGMVVLELPGGLLILYAAVRSVLNIVRRRAAAKG